MHQTLQAPPSNAICISSTQHDEETLFTEEYGELEVDGKPSNAAHTPSTQHVKEISVAEKFGELMVDGSPPTSDGPVESKVTEMRVCLEKHFEVLNGTRIYRKFAMCGTQEICRRFIKTKMESKPHLD